MKLLVMADARSVHTERWCRYFEEDGFDVALFSLEEKTIASPKKSYPASTPTGIGLIDYRLARSAFRKTLDNFRPDIVNAHFVVSYGWLATMCTQCPVVATAWGSDVLILPKKTIFHRRRVAKALAHAVYCTVDNANLADAVADFMPRDKIVRVVMGVERSAFDTLAHNVPSPGDTLRIIDPRGFRDVYDPVTVLTAAERLRGSLTFHIDMLGTPDDVTVWRAQVAKYSLDEYISVRPFLPHDEFVASLKNYDVYLSASRSDSTSVALLEAMSAGLYPVVSDIEGNREWIQPGGNGMLFKTGSGEDLAEKLKKAAAKRDIFKDVADINRSMVKNDGIWEENMKRVRDLFKELAGQ